MKKITKLLFLVALAVVLFTSLGYCGTTATMGRQDSDNNYTIETDSSHVIQVSTSATIISAGNAVEIDDDLRIGGTVNFGIDTGSTDAYSITLDPAPAAIATGSVVMFVGGTANTGACSLDVDGSGALTAKSLKSLHNADPADDYIEAGSIVFSIYDGTNWQIQTPDANP